PFITLRVDWPVVLFTGAVTAVVGLASSCAPAVLTMWRQLGDGLRDGRGIVSSARPRRMSNLLVASEVALAVALLAGGGLMIRSLRALENADPGFDAGHLAAVDVTLPAARYGRPEQMRAFFDRVDEKLAALPGATAVGWTTDPLRATSSATRDFAIDG